MSERKVILSPFVQGSFAGLQAAMDESVREGESQIDICGLLYASMIQCGVEKFAFSGGHSHANSTFIGNRTTAFPHDEWAKARDLVGQLVGPLDGKNGEQKGLVVLENFLVDVILGFKTRHSVVTALRMPDMGAVKEHLPYDAYLTVRNFISMIETDHVEGPIPREYVDGDNLYRFEEILRSDIFKSYSTSHESLEDSGFSRETALQSITSNGNQLISRHNILVAKRVALSVIPVSAKLIDTMFGKIPGSVAEFFGQQLSQILGEKRRLVIYRLDPLVKELVIQQYRKLLTPKNPGQKSITPS